MPTKGPDFLVLLWYSIAAISGGLGGCSAAATLTLTNRKQAVLSFFIAYALIGATVGMLTYGFGHMVGIDIKDTESLVLWSLLCGTAVPLAVLSQNLVAKVVLEKLGVEVQVTLRKPKSEERRRHEPSSVEKDDVK